MSFLGNIIGSLLGGIFGGGNSRKIEIPQPTVRAQDLVQSTKADAPEAPQIGQDKQKKGRKSLLIDRTQSGYDYNATNL